MPLRYWNVILLVKRWAAEAVGGAQIDILFGDVNPSGKLAETFPLKLEDTPCYAYFPGNPKTVEYREGLYVGYRYYDSAKKDVLFPFGHGLSYTTFAYSDLELSKTKLCREEELTVTCTIQNTGNVDGAEAVQAYVSDVKSTVYKPEKELRGFEKVFLKAGEKRKISITLDPRAFAYYDVTGGWRAGAGTYQILVGASSRDIRLDACVTLEADVKETALTYAPLRLAAYESAEIQQAPDDQFEALLGHPIPPAFRDPAQPFTRLDTLEDVENTVWGKRILAVVRKLGENDNQIATGGMMTEMLKGLPIRNYTTMLAGIIPERTLDGLLMLFNGKSTLQAAGVILGSLTKNLPQLAAQLKALLK